MACFSEIGTLVPAGTINGFTTGVWVLRVAACGEALVWDAAETASMNTANSVRIEDSTVSSCSKRRTYAVAGVQYTSAVAELFLYDARFLEKVIRWWCAADDF